MILKTYHFCLVFLEGIVSSLLCWEVFVPLSRLVYPSYLMHVMFIMSILYGQMDVIYVNGFNIVSAGKRAKGTSLYFDLIFVTIK